jgi:hypothetical protein
MPRASRNIQALLAAVTALLNHVIPVIYVFNGRVQEAMLGSERIVFRIRIHREYFDRTFFSMLPLNVFNGFWNLNDRKKIPIEKKLYFCLFLVLRSSQTFFI